MTDTNDLIKGIIEAQVIQALNSAPEAIEKLVKAALSKPVGADGKFDSYSSNKMPYLDWMVGEEIRKAAQDAARKVIQEKIPDIESQIRAGLSDESVVAAVTKSFVESASSDYHINVSFESQPKSRY